MKKVKIYMITFTLIITLLLASCNNQSHGNESQTKNTSDEFSEHVHSYGEYVTVVEPTCKGLGEEAATCSCGAKKTRVLSFTGHQYSEWSITKPATCSENGEKVKVCTKCGDKMKTSISATGHQFGEWETEKESSCIEEGSKKRICTACGTVESESIPAHNYSEISRKDATCESAGYIEYKCDRCGGKHKEVVQATGHKWKSATCTTAKKCQTCGKTEGEALGHSCKKGAYICSRCGKNAAKDIKPNLPSLPLTLKYYGYTKCEISDISYETIIYKNSNPDIKFTFTGKKTYDYKNGTDWVAFKVKIYDDEGFLVDSSTAMIDNLNVGDKFKEEVRLVLDDDWAEHSYRLVLEDYN